jgi:hypothetical protein
MAQKTQSSKQSVTPAPKSDKHRAPEMVARCRKMDKFGRPSNFYQSIGVAWTMSFTDKQTGEVTEGYAVKLEAIPPAWDGAFVLLPKRDTAEAELEEQQT